MAIKIKSTMLVAAMVMVLALAAAAGMVNAQMIVIKEVKIKSDNKRCLVVLKGRARPRTEACNNTAVLQKWKYMEWDVTASDGTKFYAFVNKGTGQALKSVVGVSNSVTLTSNNIGVNSPYDASIAWTTPAVNGVHAICPAQNGNLKLITGDPDWVYLSDAWSDGTVGDGQDWDFVS